MIFLTVGTGIGGGIVIDGKLYKGRDGYAGEFGHIVIEPNGRLCSCGNRGCLEAYASSQAVIGLFRKKTRSQYGDVLLEDIPEFVYKKAEEGERFAVAITGEIGFYLGKGIATLVNIFNPDTIIIGGGFARSGKLFFDSFKKSLYDSMMEYYNKKRVSIKPALSSYDAGIVGAAAVVFKSIE